LTDGFTTNAGAATDISNVSSYTATGLAVDPVLFRDNAEESVGYGSGTFSGDAVGSTATTTYDPSVAAIDASAVDISSVLVGWTGTYGTVDVLYNKTGIFTASYSSVTGLTGTTTTIRGLSSSTKYYFRIRPYSDTGYAGTDSSVANVTTKTSPSISKFQGYVSGSSSMVLSWGVFTTAVVSWSISNAVVQESGEQTGLTGNTTTITGLNNLGDYTLPSRRRDTEQPERANPSS
jgi:hypothetical protein